MFVVGAPHRAFCARVNDEVDRAEAERWRSLVSVFRTHVPELETWWNDWDGDIERATPGTVWNVLCLRLLDSDAAPRIEHLEVWVRVLSLIEVVEEAIEIVGRIEGERSDDATVLYAFANAGILCNVGWNRDGLSSLLRFMGPRTAVAARHDIAYHGRVEREWGGHDVDWSSATSDFRSLPITPNDMMPLDLRSK